jgi:hypothetical protein
MRKVLLLCATFVLFTSQVTFSDGHTNLTGGLSLILGTGFEDAYPGFNVTASLYGAPVKYLGIGMSVGYERFGVRIPSYISGDVHSSIHIWTTMPLVRGICPIAEEFEVFGEIADGPALMMARIWDDYSSDSDMTFGNMLSVGSGLQYRKFQFCVRLKHVFVRGSVGRWMNFNVGYAY